MSEYELGKFAETTEEATRTTELFTNIALQKILKEPAESALECEECGVDIPEKRREALKSIGGTKLCIDCATMLQSKNRLYN